MAEAKRAGVGETGREGETKRVGDAENGRVVATEIEAEAETSGLRVVEPVRL